MKVRLVISPEGVVVASSDLREEDPMEDETIRCFC